MSKGEEVLSAALADSHAKVSGEGASALDPTIIITVIGMILDFIKSCRNQGEAAARIKEGGALSFMGVRKALTAGGYADELNSRERRIKIREVAREMTAKGKTATQADIDAILAEANDIPDPPGGGATGPWPFAILLAVGLIFSNVAQAQSPFPVDYQPAAQPSTSLYQPSADLTSGPWPQLTEDVSFIKREVTSLGAAVTQMAQQQQAILDRLDKLAAERVAPEAPAVETPAPPPEPSPQKTSGIAYKGRSIGDVGAFIKANPYQTQAVMAKGYENQIDSHLRSHGYSGSFSGLDYGTKIHLHSIAHRSGSPVYPSLAGDTVAKASYAPSQAAAGSCASGNCSRPAMSYSSGYSGGHWKTGLFGRTRWVPN